MSETETKRIKVWDGATRLFHWSLAILFGLSCYSAFQDKFGIYADMHVYSGVAIIILVVWRILWGLWGSETARFKTFVKSPRAMKAYLDLEDHRGFVGHNPIGGVSVVFALLLLLVQAVMGLFASDGMLFSGPFSYRIDSTDANDITNIHETVGYVLMGWVALHVLAIIYHRVAMHTNLLTPMITGWLHTPTDARVPRIAPWWQALALLAAAAGGIYWWIFGA